MQLPEELFSVGEALKMLAGALKRLGDIHGFSVLLPLFSILLGDQYSVFVCLLSSSLGGFVSARSGLCPGGGLG
jgi:hypothetical protein